MDCEKIGALIAHLRKEQGMTQQELAERIQISNKAPKQNSYQYDQ